MRADRLIRVLFTLQSREVVTAADLAADLEVSVATARRDLEALAMAGVPVYPRRGRDGGWRLVGGARTNLTGLTEPETTALFALLGQASGGAAEATSAVRKLLAAVPPTFRGGAERVLAASLDGLGSWGDAPRVTPPELPMLQQAIAQQKAVVIAYRGREPIAVTPLGVATRGAHWYLLADRGDEHPRMYRVDRMRTVTVQDEHAAPPAGFDVRVAWSEAVAGVEALRGSTSAEVLALAHAAPALLDVFGAQATMLGADDDGRIRIEVRAQSVPALAEQLAGWTSAIEVLGPSPVRQALADFGARLVATYG